MAAINDLVNQIENFELRERIQHEINRMNKQKKFGLVFEEHLPECTPLYGVPVRTGSLVALKNGDINNLYTVLKMNKKKAMCKKHEEMEITEFMIDELVSVAKFGDPIYPCLKSIDSICNAPDSDLWHTLIEADNYHALQLLEYTFMLVKWIVFILIPLIIQVQKTGNIIIIMSTTPIHIATVNGFL